MKIAYMVAMFFIFCSFTYEMIQDREERKTKDGLINQTLRSIQSKTTLHVFRMIPINDLIRVCPFFKEKMTDAKINELREKVTKDMEVCNRLIDWAKAKEVKREGGNEKNIKEGCTGGDVRALEAITVIFDVEGKKVQMKIDDPIKLNGIYSLLESPICEEIKE